MSAKAATFTLVGCFLVGAIGIAILSQILHRYIPHSVVDCDHEHGDEEEGKMEDEEDAHAQSHSRPRSIEEQRAGLLQLDGAQDAERHQTYTSYGGVVENHHPRFAARRPSLHTQISTKVSQLVTGSKEFCDENGQCFGYSDPCGQECFRNVQHARPQRLHPATGKAPTRPVGSRAQTMPYERQPLLQHVDEETTLAPIASGPAALENSHSSLPSMNGNSIQKHPSSQSLASHSSSNSSHSTHNHHAQHHHHVPTNVFLSIGLQTSIAIALHKMPEGFITYATNHANPRLGFAIFLALFIHNITEGFAMALPLYLAINSRWKAMFWSALLGGVSQPLGAAIAALWFKIAKRGAGEGAGEPGETVYGAMFAVTAGIMAMVSVQLLGESLDLTHSRRLCFASAFIGMGILGLSSALTA